VDVGALLDDGAEAWAPLATAFGSSLSVEPLRGRALVRADPLRLAQACGNLVANALEHGGSPVRVRGRVVAGRVRIEVSDAGPGLPEPVSGLIARRGRGAPRGRGLTIAARIARDHGGRLSSAPSSRGACLVIELPSADAAPAIEPFPPSRFDPTWRPDTRPIPLDPSWRPGPRSTHLRDPDLGPADDRLRPPDPEPPPSRPTGR
jgi:signal transduction histidine kinase